MGWNIVLFVGLGALLLAGLFLLVEYVRSGAFYLKSLLDMVKQLDEAKSETPRSLSSVTALVLDDVKRDFPEYNLSLVLLGVKKDAAAYLESFPAGKCLLEDGVSPELREQVASDVARGLIPVSGGVRVGSAVIHAYRHDSRDKVLEYQAAAEYTDPDLRRRQTRLTLQYIAMFTGDVARQNVSFSCPNCGAPVSRVGSKVCAYCGTALDLSAELSWTLISVAEG